MPQTYPYLVITDGTTTVTLQDGSNGATNYPLVRDGWAPAIPGLRMSPLAGQTPYEDVLEQMLIEVNGATAAAALANLLTLARLLDQAARWYRGEGVQAVLVKCAWQGSTISSTAAPLQAAILGGGITGLEPGLKLSPRFNEVGRNYVIPNVVLSFTRRGLWLTETEDSVSSAATNNGSSVLSLALAASLAVQSPTRVTVSNFGYGKSTGNRFLGGYLLVSDPSPGGGAPIVISNAEAGASGAWTSVAGGLNALNTNVLRYTPASTSESFSATLGAPALDASADLVAVFACVRPSATVSFQLRARVNSRLENIHTPLVSIPANAAAYPYWVFLGVVPSSGSLTALYLAATASSAASNLDIDSVVVCDARMVNILALIGPGDNDLNGTVVTSTLHANHELLTEPAATVVDGTTPVPFLGSAEIYTKSNTIYAIVLATGGGTTATGLEYRQASTSTDVVLQNVVSLARRTAYLVPQ